MKFTSDNVQISSDESILWEDVKTLRLINDRLDLVLKDGNVVHFSSLQPFMIDKAFRLYERYLRDHPDTSKRV